MATLPTEQAKINTFRQIRDLIGGPAKNFAAAAVFWETGDLKSKVSQADKNYSGIKFINKPYQVATKGSPAPKNEGGGNYAKYSSTAAWANDYARILKLKPGIPYNATSLEDFVKRLKMNNYFTDSEANYLKGVKFFYNKYTGNALQADAAHEKAKAATYANANDALKKKLNNTLAWNEFKDQFLTTKNMLIGGGILFGLILINRS